MVSQSLYYTPVGHHVNPRLIHHTQEHTHSLYISDRRSVIVKAVEHLVCLTHTKAKPLYYILNQGSIITLSEEHLVCLVTNLGTQIETIMASWILHAHAHAKEMLY